MIQKISVLAITHNTNLISSVKNGVEAFEELVDVYTKSSVQEAIDFLEKSDIDTNRIQVYLDCKLSRTDAKIFVEFLDKTYRGVSHHSVILVDSSRSISSIMSLAIAECVFDLLYHPVLSAEVETAIRKRFSLVRTRAYA